MHKPERRTGNDGVFLGKTRNFPRDKMHTAFLKAWYVDQQIRILRLFAITNSWALAQFMESESLGVEP